MEGDRLVISCGNSTDLPPEKMDTGSGYSEEAVVALAPAMLGRNLVAGAGRLKLHFDREGRFISEIASSGSLNVRQRRCPTTRCSSELVGRPSGSLWRSLLNVDTLGRRNGERFARMSMSTRRNISP
jgi:hypothetical protein